MAFGEVIWTCLTLISFFPHSTLVTVIINAYTIFMPLFLGWGKIQFFLCQAGAVPCSPGGPGKTVQNYPVLPIQVTDSLCAHNDLHDSNPAKPMLLMSRHSGLCPQCPCRLLVPSCCTWHFLTRQHCGCQLCVSSAPASPSHPFRSPPAAPLPKFLSIHGNELFHSSRILKEFFSKRCQPFFFSDYTFPALWAKKV